MESNTKDRPDILGYMRMMHKADICARRQNFMGAFEAYREALQYKPGAAELYGTMAKCLLLHNKTSPSRQNIQQARMFARTYVSKAPDKDAAHRTLAFILSETGDQTDAKIHALKAMMIAPESPDNNVVLGKVYWKRREYGEARKCFEEALRLSPQNVNALLNCANYWHLTRSDTSKTREYVTRALKIAPDNVSALTLMGHVLLHEKRVDEAMEHARIVMSKDPNDYEALFLIAAIETRRNPLQGMGFRILLWYNRLARRRLHFLFVIPLVWGGMYLCYRLGINDMFGIFLPTAFFLYLGLCRRNLKNYVRKNFQQPQKLKQDF
jgi:cytochrome c-type biogenesis protein CcmH/NrfG